MVNRTMTATSGNAFRVHVGGGPEKGTQIACFRQNKCDRARFLVPPAIALLPVRTYRST